MRRYALAFLVATTCTLAACERAPEQPAGPADAAPLDTATVDTPSDAPGAGGAIDATAVVDRSPVAGADGGFDVKSFAGAFTADGTTLVLAADGTYTFQAGAESPDADMSGSGTWTVEDDGTALLLDPDSKEAPDRRYAIASNDELAAETGAQVLRRAAD